MMRMVHAVMLLNRRVNAAVSAEVACITLLAQVAHLSWMSIHYSATHHLLRPFCGVLTLFRLVE